MIAFRCNRFWIPRDEEVVSGLDGFPIDPESSYGRHLNLKAASYESLAHFRALCLLGEPGMGKTTIITDIAETINQTSPSTGEVALLVDLGASGSEFSLREQCDAIAGRLKEPTCRKLHLFFDSLEDGLLTNQNFVKIFLGVLRALPRERLLIRIASRSSEWPPDLESGLGGLFGSDQISVYQLMPLRRTDVSDAAESRGVSGSDFLSDIDRVRVAPLASRPITLRFLLKSFEDGKGLSTNKADLYRRGCLALADEWRTDRRTRRHTTPKLRFAIASRLAAALIFSGKPSFWVGPRYLAGADDLLLDDISGGYGIEKTQESFDLPSTLETVETGLFCSKSITRVGFAHQTYAEYLAASYLVDNDVADHNVRDLIFHSDGSDRIVPQLSETAAWLAALSLDFREKIIKSDPEALLFSDTPLAEEIDRVELLRQTLFRNEQDGSLRCWKQAR